MEPYRKSKLLIFIRLHTFRIEECLHAPYPESIRQLASKGSLSLDDLLSLGAKNEVRLFISGYDAFSGARKVYIFSYSREKVRTGSFIRDTMTLVPRMEPSASDRPIISASPSGD